MLGRVHGDETPEGRLAAVARSLAVEMANQQHQTGCGPSEPDYADYRDALRPFIRRELLLARIDEARRVAGLGLTARMEQLATELADAEANIAIEDRL
jgi:hypothetical protein